MRDQRNDETITCWIEQRRRLARLGSYAEAEGLRVRACARLSQGAPLAEVEALLQRELATARRQNARLFELRTATSLAQVWRDVGRLDNARTLLASTYGWFTSGHDTVDLTQARAVLNGMR